MNAAQITQALAPWRKRHLRSAWKPKTCSAGAHLSRFGGNPSVHLGPWPQCRVHAAPMRQLVQLDLACLPVELGFPLREGLLQLFYCAVDDGSCDTFAPFSGAQEVRIVAKTDPALARAPIEPLAMTVIEAWERFDDAPHPEEHPALGVHYAYDFKASRVHVRCDEPALALRDLSLEVEVAEQIANATPGDKLGGWPAWAQGVEYPSCSECGEAMQLLMQIDSNDHLDYMFGDAGCGHLTYCGKHPQVLAFGWACG